jgi:hypothetical protein
MGTKLAVWAAWCIMYASGGLHAGNASACDTAIQNFQAFGPTATDNTNLNTTIGTSHAALETQAGYYPATPGSYAAWFASAIPEGLALANAIAGA